MKKSLGFVDLLAPSSRAMYLSHYRNYFRLLYNLDPTTVPSRDELEAMAKKYFESGRDYEKDVEDFILSMKGRAPLGISSARATVRTLLSENKVELPNRFWKSLGRRIKGSRARTMDKVPSNLEIRLLLMEMPLQGRAFYIVKATSGMRIGEVLQLKVNDIELRTDPARINIRGEYTKTGNPRVTFITSEAKEWVERWLPQREDYIRESAERAKSLGQMKVADDRLFPFSKNVAQEMFNSAAKRVPGLSDKDPSTGRMTVHPHTLRKFFRTKLGAVNVDFTEALMGHEGYLKGVYRRYTTDDLARFYKNNEQILTFMYDERSIDDMIADKTKGASAAITAQAVEIGRLKQQQELLLRKQEADTAEVKGTLREVTESLRRVNASHDFDVEKILKLANVGVTSIEAPEELARRILNVYPELKPAIKIVKEQSADELDDSV